MENYEKVAIASLAKATWGFMRSWHVAMAWSPARAEVEGVMASAWVNE